MVEIIHPGREALSKAYETIEESFFDPATSNSDRLRILRRFVSYQQFSADINKEQRDKIQRRIGWAFEGSIEEQTTPLFDFQRKYSHLMDSFSDPLLDRNKREAIILTLLDGSGKEGLIPQEKAGHIKEFISDVMSRETANRMGWAKKGGPVVESLRDMFPGLNWWI